MMSVLGLIPARGGSKGVLRKNVRLLGGKPLLQYTAEAALGTARLSRIIVTTEDPEVAAVARRCGCEVPFVRPPALAGDGTPMLAVVQHAVRWLEARGDQIDAVCLLQPTHPFRLPDEIDGCIALMEQGGYDAVATFQPVPDRYHPSWVFIRDQEGLLRISTGAAEPVGRRQNLAPAFHRDGSVYVTRRDALMEQGSLYGTRLAGYFPARAWSINIDTLADWQLAEQWLAARGADALRSSA